MRISDWSSDVCSSDLTDHRGHRLGHLTEEAQAILQRAAVLVVALIAVRGNELVDQITVGGVDFHAVETGVEGVASGLCIELYQLLDLGGGQCTWHRRRRQGAGAGTCLDEYADALGRDRRWRHRGFAIGLQRGVRDPADMPELGEDGAALGVYRIGNLDRKSVV